MATLLDQYYAAAQSAQSSVPGSPLSLHASPHRVRNTAACNPENYIINSAYTTPQRQRLPGLHTQHPPQQQYYVQEEYKYRQFDSEEGDDSGYSGNPSENFHYQQKEGSPEYQGVKPRESEHEYATIGKYQSLSRCHGYRAMETASGNCVVENYHSSDGHVTDPVLDRYTEYQEYNQNEYPEYKEYNKHSMYREGNKTPEFTSKLHGGLTYKSYGGYDEISYSPTNCYMVLTCRSVLWMSLTLISTMLVVGSIMTPQWLVGRARPMGLRLANGSAPTSFHPTLGIFNRCTRLKQLDNFKRDHCATFVTSFSMPAEDFPDFWKSALIFFSVAMLLLGVTVVSAVMSLCVRAVCRKSIFTVSGLVQSIAGLFLVVGLVLYPAGWGAARVRNICGEHAGAFTMADCTVGWAFCACAFGTVLVFTCAITSIQAEIATSRDKIESKVLEGKSIICVR